MFVQNKHKSSQNILCPKSLKRKLLWRTKSYIASKLMKLQKSENEGLHSPAFFPCSLHKFLNKSKFDIINLHWVQSEMLSIESIGKIKKPLVWTLHDYWAFSGSEHYPNNLLDKRYEEGYFKGNKLNSSHGIDINKWCWDRKLKNWKHPINIVCPSRWLENCVKNSFLMKDWPTSVIANPIPTDIYRPWPKTIGRELFKLPKEKFLILFSSLNVKDNRKGYDLLFSSLKILSKRSNIDFEVVVLGNYDNKIKNDIYFKKYFIDLLSDDQSISMLYSAADLMIVPSRMENLPQSATEAQSCGLPVVGFDCTGMNDVVKDNETGFLVNPYDTKELANAIEYLFLNPVVVKLFSKNARNFALKNWSEDIISKKYIDLYDQVLTNYS